MNMKRGLLFFIILSFFLTGYGQGNDYKKLYREFIKSEEFSKNFTDWEWYLDWCDGWEYIYLDSDDIPELLLYGKDDATGNYILSVQSGGVVVQALGDGNPSYIPQSGLLSSYYGGMGYFCEYVLYLNQLFHPVLTFTIVIDFQSVYGSMDEAENYDEAYEQKLIEQYSQYYRGIADDTDDLTEITKEEYERAMNAAYKSKGKSVNIGLSDNKKDVDSLIKELELWK